MAEEKITGFEARYDSIVQTAEEEYEATPPSDYYRNGYNLYLLQLYQALHPEKREVTEDEIEDVTIKNVLVDTTYNDLGVSVGNRLIILVESRSTFTFNIIIRALMYLIQTIRIHKDRNVLREYLMSKEQEDADIMMTLFDDEHIMKAYEKDIKDSTAREVARETAERMIKLGKMSLEEISVYVPALSLDELKEIETEVMQFA